MFTFMLASFPPARDLLGLEQSAVGLAAERDHAQHGAKIELFDNIKTCSLRRRRRNKLDNHHQPWPRQWVRPVHARGNRAGRKLFAGDWQFVAAAGSPASLPVMKGVEIAFAGRSNVGKSSLINALSGRKNSHASRAHPAARRSSYSSTGRPPQRGDMPGYGYAAAAKSRSRLDGVDRCLFARRSNLARVYLCGCAARTQTDGRPALDALDRRRSAIRSS